MDREREDIIESIRLVRELNRFSFLDFGSQQMLEKRGKTELEQEKQEEEKR